MRLNRTRRCLLFVFSLSLGLLFGYQLLIKNEAAKSYLPIHLSVLLTFSKNESTARTTKTTNTSQVKKTDERLQINRHYVARFNSTLIGKEFKFDNVTLAIVKSVLRNQTFKRKPVESVDAKTPFFDIVVPVTGCSSNHFGEFKGNIGQFTKHYPGVKMFFYDLGLSDSEVNQVKEMPFMVYRKFDFEAYPAHVRNLHNYAWKVLIIQQMLSEFDGTMWFDSSVKFLENQQNHTRALMEQLAHHNSGMMFYLPSTGHSIIAATHPGMMQYFPMENAGAVKNMLQASAVIYINKDEVQRYILKWLVICALKQDCIAPPGSKLFCGFNFPRDRFGGCHRYDQSLQNILVSNAYNSEEEKYHYTASDTFAVMNRG